MPQNRSLIYNPLFAGPVLSVALSLCVFALKTVSKEGVISDTFLGNFASMHQKLPRLTRKTQSVANLKRRLHTSSHLDS